MASNTGAGNVSGVDLFIDQLFAKIFLTDEDRKDTFIVSFMCVALVLLTWFDYKVAFPATIVFLTLSAISAWTDPNLHIKLLDTGGIVLMVVLLVYFDLFSVVVTLSCFALIKIGMLLAHKRWHDSDLQKIHIENYLQKQRIPLLEDGTIDVMSFYGLIHTELTKLKK